MAEIKIKRAYETADASDGFRVYIDRLWPRGLSHETFRYDMWDKDIAPSTELREWFHADTAGRWDEFKEKYSEELSDSDALASLRKELAKHPTVTLLYSSHDPAHNNAVIVKEMLEHD